MTTTEIVLSVILGIVTTWFLVHRGKVKTEQELIHNRINALADEAHRMITGVRNDVMYVAKNAQGIASNALSSAQRAESKIQKQVKPEETATGNA